MLVLTRRSGESLIIGENVRVRVLGSSGSRVRLGIEAPLDVRILREKPQPADASPIRVPQATGALPDQQALSEHVARHVAAVE